MKANKLLLFSLLLFLLISLRISNEVSNGWLGPNANVALRIPQSKITLFTDFLHQDDIILFDDNTFHYLKHLSNKKMPITYFKLYLDKIPDISKNNLNGSRALSFVNCAFIDEFKLYNKYLIVKNHYVFHYGGVNFCISSIAEN